MSKWITVPRQLTDEMFNVFSREIGPLPEQYARITKAWYLAVHAAPMPPAPPPEGGAIDRDAIIKECADLAGSFIRPKGTGYHTQEYATACADVRDALLALKRHAPQEERQ
jgi:hypothetical protein